MIELFECNRTGDQATLYLHTDIGGQFFDGVTSADVASQLEEVRGVPELLVRINSLGGDVAQGVAIYNLLRESESRVTTITDGYAASVGSVIFMAGESREMAKASRLMMHDAWTREQGSAAVLRKTADRMDEVTGMLAGVYADRSGVELDKVKEMMAAETWLQAEAAVELGLATSVTEDQAIAAYAGPWDAFRNAPSELASMTKGESRVTRFRTDKTDQAVANALGSVDIADAVCKTSL